MRPLSKKFKQEWDYFINPKTGKVQYNATCLKCVHDCKQSHKVVIVHCRKNKKKE